jgi:imidazolonepropionase-like amidohydrolase
MKYLRLFLGLAVVVASAVYGLWFWPLRNPHPWLRAPSGALAVRGAKIYPSPGAPPIEHGTVLMRDGVIVAVGADVVPPPGAQVLACDSCTIVAGFWNTHVHFTEPKWNSAAWKSAGTLYTQIADMLTSRGFTTVVDTGSDLRVTISLRRRIETGEVAGPRIYTAGSGQYPPNGIPYYLKNSLPAYMLWFMPQPATPEEAARVEERNIARGADILKLFTGSWVERGKVLPMPVANAKAAVEVAHRHRQLAFSHPSNLAGAKVAIDSGVDVLAHAPDSTEGIDAALFRAMVDRHMAMIPTLKMFATTVTTNPAYLQPIYEEVRTFHALGGQLMFGTDVGYMTDYRTDDEFRALEQCGLGMEDILRMLTTAPTERFRVAHETGTLTPGKHGDLVVLDGDPAQDLMAFARVRWTIRSGRPVYARP